MFVHARCGGTLLPIADPPWYGGYKDGTGPRLFVRCDRCRMPGEVAQKEPSPQMLEEGS